MRWHRRCLSRRITFWGFTTLRGMVTCHDWVLLSRRCSYQWSCTHSSQLMVWCLPRWKFMWLSDVRQFQPVTLFFKVFTAVHFPRGYARVSVEACTKECDLFFYSTWDDKQHAGVSTEEWMSFLFSVAFLPTLLFDFGHVGDLYDYVYSPSHTRFWHDSSRLRRPIFVCIPSVTLAFDHCERYLSLVSMHCMVMSCFCLPMVTLFITCSICITLSCLFLYEG